MDDNQLAGSTSNTHLLVLNVTLQIEEAELFRGGCLVLRQQIGQTSFKYLEVSKVKEISLKQPDGDITKGYTVNFFKVLNCQIGTFTQQDN